MYNIGNAFEGVNKLKLLWKHINQWSSYILQFIKTTFMTNAAKNLKITALRSQLTHLNGYYIICLYYGSVTIALYYYKSLAYVS